MKYLSKFRTATNLTTVGNGNNFSTMIQNQNRRKMADYNSKPLLTLLQKRDFTLGSDYEKRSFAKAEEKNDFSNLYYLLSHNVHYDDGYSFKHLMDGIFVRLGSKGLGKICTYSTHVEMPLLHCLLRCDHINEDIYKFLLEYSDLKQQDFDGFTPLHHGVYNREVGVQCLKSLVGNGDSLFIQDYYSKIPLVRSASAYISPLKDAKLYNQWLEKTEYLIVEMFIHRPEYIKTNLEIIFSHYAKYGLSNKFLDILSNTLNFHTTHISSNEKNYDELMKEILRVRNTRNVSRSLVSVMDIDDISEKFGGR